LHSPILVPMHLMMLTGNCLLGPDSFLKKKPFHKSKTAAEYFLRLFC